MRSERGARVQAGAARSLVHHTRWPAYLGGLLTETLFILGLSVVALVIALLAKVVF